jgi:hypothetical protein
MTYDKKGRINQKISNNRPVGRSMSTSNGPMWAPLFNEYLINAENGGNLF